jgi:hypothetical protein
VVWSPQEPTTAGDVELDDRRRRDRGFLLLVGDVAPVDHEDMILRAAAHAAKLAGDPALGQLLGPGGVDGEFGRGLGVQARRREHAGKRKRRGGCEEVVDRFHGLPP